MSIRYQNKAVLYRMVTDEHICPYGIKSKDLLEKKGYEVEDHHLTTRAETDAFMKRHGVKTTPQTFINGNRVGGFDALQDFFHMEREGDREPAYEPIIAVFGVTFLMALMSTLSGFSVMNAFLGNLVGFFVAYSMCVLSVLKLRDLDAFSLRFVTYDLLATRWVNYSYIYPFAEAVAGIGMLAGSFFLPLVAPLALTIGTIGAISVIKAVYIDKRDLKCACVGGNSKVPLGAISLTENLMMVIMPIWMILATV